MCANVDDRVCLLIEDWKDANIIHTESGHQQSFPTVTRVYPCHQALRQMQATMCIGKGRPLSCLKCNFDASFSETLNCMGIGICVRDNEEAFVLAKNMSFSSLCYVPVGEALGVYRTIEWLSDM